MKNKSREYMILVGDPTCDAVVGAPKVGISSVAIPRVAPTPFAPSVSEGIWAEKHSRKSKTTTSGSALCVNRNKSSSSVSSTSPWSSIGARLRRN